MSDYWDNLSAITLENAQRIKKEIIEIPWEKLVQLVGHPA